MASTALKSHAAGARSLLDTGEHSDLILRCNDGTEFNVHQAIIYSQSKFFQKACKPETSKQEGRENLVNVIVGDAATISTLLRYLYTLQYVDESQDNIVTDVNFYVAADFYDVPVLKTLMSTQFKLHLAHQWNSEAFPMVIETIYTDIPSTDRTLRDLVLDVVMAHATELLEKSEHESRTLTSVMDKLPGLGKDLALRMYSKLDKHGLGREPTSNHDTIKIEVNQWCQCGNVMFGSPPTYRAWDRCPACHQLLRDCLAPR